MYNSMSKKTQQALAAVFDNKGKVIQEIQEVKKIVLRNEQLIEEYQLMGRNDLAKKYATLAARAEDRLEYLKEEASVLDDLAINIRISGRDFDPHRKRDYRKINRVTTDIINKKEKTGPLESEERNALEETLGRLNRLQERESSVRGEMKESYYVPGPEIEKKAEEYMKKVSAKIQSSQQTAAGLEKKIDEEKVVIT
ncbi:MAG: hypothetical protein JSW73_03095 [Candidatus Woesearchaeota archaeon]|nr:MAG: hypothetical protein JSW73_03095 [Candidatus Woesearchaeota archaeon]